MKQCDICQGDCDKTYIDGKTTSGPWANMCFQCFKKHGQGLGLGKGQMYTKQVDGSWKMMVNRLRLVIGSGIPIR